MKHLGIALTVLLALSIAIPAMAVGPVVTAGTCGLLWDAPTTNTDGTALTDLSRYRIYVGTAPGVTKNTTPTAEVAAPNPAPTPGTTGEWACTGLTRGQKYAVVTAVDLIGNESGESNEVPFVFEDLPRSPSNLRMR